MNFKKTWKRFMNMSRSREGFTLVELIVVIAILAILAGVAIPVYSGYITKANEAADQQLLGVLNTAFGAACLENGFAVQSVTAANLAVSNKQVGALSGVTSSTATVDEAKLNASFQKYLAGNDLTFKTIEALTYDPGNSVFVVAGAATSVWAGFFGGISDKVSGSVTDVNNSAFGDIGAKDLMEKVDVVTGLAAGLAGINNDFKDVLAGNLEDMAAVMGYDIVNNEKDEAAFFAELNNMVNQITPGTVDENGEVSDSDAYNAATNQILANYAVLQAAKSTTKDSATLLGELQSGINTEEIKNLMTSKNTANTQEGLSKAAMMYAMYTAYANGLPEGTQTEKETKAAALESAKTVEGFLANMNSDGFQAYLDDPNSSAEDDLKGYLGALNIINESVKSDKTGAAVSDLLVNGYNNTDLVTGLEGLLGK